MRSADLLFKVCGSWAERHSEARSLGRRISAVVAQTCFLGLRLLGVHGEEPQT
jgi:hypothetical protein